MLERSGRVPARRKALGNSLAANAYRVASDRVWLEKKQNDQLCGESAALCQKVNWVRRNVVCMFEELIRRLDYNAIPKGPVPYMEGHGMISKKQQGLGRHTCSTG